MPIIFNNQLRQVLLLGLIILLGGMLLTNLYIFLPGFLGGVTMYILLRKWYERLTIQKKWPKGLTALLFIIAIIVVISIPIYFSVLLVSLTHVKTIQRIDKAIPIFCQIFRLNFFIHLTFPLNYKHNPQCR